ncbi:MAG: sigma factor-like helix-turn-helix DNA-binding protein [Bacilli bacterium]
MEENIKILNMWNEKVKTLGKLKLKEAQELFIEMKKESNIKEKELKRKKLIEDTLYVPLNFINKNKVYFTNTISYDMNDVISTIYEIWIELIDAEIFVSIDKYSNIFNYNSLFYTKLLDKLPIAKYSFERVVVLNTTNFAEILINYIKLKEITPEVTYNKYLDFIKKELNKNKDFFKYFPGYYCLYNIYTLLEAITNKLTEVDSSKLSKVKIDKLKYLLIDRGLTDSIQTFEESLLIDIEKAIIEDNYNSQILNTLLNGLNGEEVELIRKRFGIGEYRCHTLEEVAKQINVTRERVRQREIKTLSKLRRIAARKKVRY